MTKKIMWIGLAGALALVGAGLAVAAMQAKGTSAGAFAFTASAGEPAKTRTCTGVDGTYSISHTVYTGTASSGLYNGQAVTVRLKTTVNTTENAGVAKGTIAFRGDDQLQAKGNLVGVVDGDTITGVVTGRDVRGEDRGALIANYSATLGTGTLSLTAGDGSAANEAILFGGTGCERRTTSGATGQVSAISTTSVTVATSGGNVTCSLSAEQGARLADRIEVGDRVRITCDADGKLVKLGRQR
ncbi:MAG: hypothetical protein WD689_04030 [Gaiellaceae bacterium]